MPDPRYRWAKFFSFYDRGRGWRYPVCPNGHPLRSLVIGNMKPSSFAFGLWRGFGISFLVYFSTALYIVGKFHGLTRLSQFVVAISAAILSGYGLIALAFAWSWAESKGPKGRLTSRSAGVAFGQLLPALIMWFALAAGGVDWLSALDPQRIVALFSRTS